FLHDEELQVFAERCAEARIVVRIWLGVSCCAITSALVPGDECVTNMQHADAHASRTTGTRVVFRGIEQLAPELLILQLRPNGQQAELPDAIAFRVQPWSAQRRTILFLAID